jgi:hypothetical protein
VGWRRGEVAAMLAPPSLVLFLVGCGKSTGVRATCAYFKLEKVCLSENKYGRVLGARTAPAVQVAHSQPE